ncbi:DUF4149 domain-containing protein [Jeongeupia sp. USM3]|uniref:DUF4149 domain-containing protein n=1 Tax=Jeongeupia sp. USM3 TaxID=1906741 RepID=UPI00089DF3C4|nr:DUF4149 domain-containing protein [Jeongeupia sp. USM3]AOY02382.1 hypothetical protein BJP62_15685 [Jeongeupia sp. USM3]
MNLGSGIRNILTTLWIGGIWVIGVIVAPTLFRLLETPVAGMVAGRLFSAIGWVGMVAGVYLFIYWLWADGLGAFRTGRLWLVIGMLVCTLVNQFALFPLIAAVKTGVSSAATGMFGGGLAQWHTISSLIYLVQALFGLVYIWQGDSR